MLAFYSNYYEEGYEIIKSPRVPVEEQYRLIMECRKSGMSDYQWCLNNDINPGTFYNWIKRLRQSSYYEIPERNQFTIDHKFSRQEFVLLYKRIEV